MIFDISALWNLHDVDADFDKRIQRLLWQMNASTLPIREILEVVLHLREKELVQL